MTCPYCNASTPDGAASCRQCGRVLDLQLVARLEAGGVDGRTPTIVEPADPPLQATPPPPRPATTPSPPPSGGRRGHTVYLPSEDDSGDADPHVAARPGARKVVGVLVTYSWESAGEIFPVREGRNLIGRGEECDIRIAKDRGLSQVNSHISFRRGFVIGDMVSMGGTDVDGEPIEEQFRPLRNYAQIRTGSTLWTFVALAGPDIAE